MGAVRGGGRCGWEWGMRVVRKRKKKKKQSGEGENNLVHLKKMLSWYPGIRSHAFA